MEVTMTRIPRYRRREAEECREIRVPRTIFRSEFVFQARTADEYLICFKTAAQNVLSPDIWKTLPKKLAECFRLTCESKDTSLLNMSRTPSSACTFHSPVGEFFHRWVSEKETLPCISWKVISGFEPMSTNWPAVNIRCGEYRKDQSCPTQKNRRKSREIPSK